MPSSFGVSPEEYTNYAIIIGSVTTIGLLVADRMALSESGCEPPSMLWGIPPAWYPFWKRATITKGRVPFIIIVAPLVWIIFIGIPHKDEVALEEAACPLVLNYSGRE